MPTLSVKFSNDQVALDSVNGSVGLFLIAKELRLANSDPNLVSELKSKYTECTDRELNLDRYLTSSSEMKLFAAIVSRSLERVQLAPQSISCEELNRLGVGGCLTKWFRITKFGQQAISKELAILKQLIDRSILRYESRLEPKVRRVGSPAVGGVRNPLTKRSLKDILAAIFSIRARNVTVR